MAVTNAMDGANVVNGLTVTASTGTLTIANGKTATVSNSITMAGTDTTTMTFPSTSATIARTDALQTFTGSQAGTVTVLTSSSNSTAINLALGPNFSAALSENTTFANPTNVTAGTSGQIAVTQNASAAKTLAFGSNWKEITGATPTVSTTLSAINLMSWYAVDSTHIFYSFQKNGQT